MNNDWAFLPMQVSNDLLGDSARLRERLATDSYLYFEQVIDPVAIQTVRDDFTTILADEGWIRGGPARDRAVSISKPVREGDAEFFAAYDRIQKLESFHTMAHHPALAALMTDVLGPTAFPHPLKIARLSFPGHYEISTPPHQDFPNNQGTENLTATWLPLGDIPVSLGGLAVLRGSAAYGVLPLGRHLGPGNRQALVPLDMLEALRWVTTDYAAGDVLVFGSTTVHASLHNASETLMRLSIDFRHQLEGEALTPGCLEPHFGRAAWEDIYEGWSSEQHQFYWHDLDYEVVPFVEFDLDADTATEAELLERIVRYENRRDVRHERKVQTVAEQEPPGDGDG